VTAGLQPEIGAGLRAFLVGVADDELLTGHVLTSVAGWGPELELNIAMSSIGQDEIGHARRLYEFLLGDGAEVERFVYERPAAEFRATALTRTYPSRWESVLVRQYLYETADAARTAVLAASGRADVAALFGEMVHEERYHLDFWTTWLRSTVSKGVEGRRRVQLALDEVWPLAQASFGGPVPADDEVDLGLPAGALTAAYRAWAAEVEVALAELGLVSRTDDGTTVPDALDAMLEEMRCVYRTAPGSW
jgi:phenylacetate-CoA oxygenase PaaI subunit